MGYYSSYYSVSLSGSGTSCPACGGYLAGSSNATPGSYYSTGGNYASDTYITRTATVGETVTIFGLSFYSSSAGTVTKYATGYYLTGSTQGVLCMGCERSYSNGTLNSVSITISVEFKSSSSGGSSGGNSGGSSNPIYSHSLSHSEIYEGESATLSWSTDSSPSYYYVTVYRNGTAVTEDYVSGSYRSYTYSGSRNWYAGDTYRFKLTAYQSGYSDYWYTSTYTVRAIVTVPSSPSNVYASNKEIGKTVTVYWSSVSNATSYTVRIYRNGSQLSSASTSSTSYSITLSSSTWSVGDTYYFSVAAKNSAGTSSYSSSATYKVLAVNQAPSTPASITVSTIKAGNNTTISWSQSIDPEGTVVNYNVYMRYNKTSSADSGFTSWSKITTTSALYCTYTVPSQYVGYYIQFAVEATDGSLTSNRVTSQKYLVSSESLMASANINGVHKDITDAYCNIGGVWKKYTQIYSKISSTWKPLYY